jgi:hypothetical protein
MTSPSFACDDCNWVVAGFPTVVPNGVPTYPFVLKLSCETKFEFGIWLRNVLICGWDDFV